MHRYLHHLSAIFFYALGVTFFLAWMLMKNLILVQPSAVWLQVADLPLIFSAVVYGGLSLYLSLRSENEKILPWLIGIPLAIFFVLILVMNFWPH